MLLAALCTVAAVVSTDQLVAAAPSNSSAMANVIDPSNSDVGGVPGFIPLSPVRVLETRSDQAAFRGRGAFEAQETAVIDVVSIAQLDPAKVAGVSLSVTVVRPTSGGFLTLWPTGTLPTASTLNFVAGQTVPNGALVGLDPQGRIKIFNGSGGTIHVLVDIQGWVPVGAGFTSITPVRVLETRPGFPGYGGQGALGPSTSRSIPVVSRLGLPGSVRVTGVAVNITSADASASSFFRVSPDVGAGFDASSSSLNFAAGQTVANSAVLGIGSNGNLQISNAFGSANAIVDITGYFVDGLSFRPMEPRRLVDTRNPGGQGLIAVSCADGTGTSPKPTGPFPGSSCYALNVHRSAGLPAGMVGAAALNVTVAQASSSGFLSVWPSSSDRPVVSSSNFVPGQVVANTVIVGVDDYITVYNGSALAVHVIIDITGWFPEDAVGLVADAREMRRYANGEDLIGVAVCDVGGTVGVGTAVANLNATVAPYFNRLSGGVYRQRYVAVGTVTGTSRSQCNSRVDALSFPPGMTALAVIQPDLFADGGGRKTASGSAGPGFGCFDITCTYPATFPGNVRRAEFTPDVVARPSGPWSVAAHEFGHTLSWPHSYSGASRSCPGGSWSGFSPYDNPLDVMSDTPTGCRRDPLSGAQGTMAFNRYAAGWLSLGRVRRHDGGAATYQLGAVGTGQVEMVVIPSLDPLAFTTIEARTRTGDDAALVQAGVALHRIDQRPGVSCRLSSGLQPDRCSSLVRRQQQYPASPSRGVVENVTSYDGVLSSVGQTIVLEGNVSVELVAIQGQVYSVRVTGASATFAPPVRLTQDGAADGHADDILRPEGSLRS